MRRTSLPLPLYLCLFVLFCFVFFLIYISTFEGQGAWKWYQNMPNFDQKLLLEMLKYILSKKERVKYMLVSNISTHQNPKKLKMEAE